MDVNSTRWIYKEIDNRITLQDTYMETIYTGTLVNGYVHSKRGLDMNMISKYRFLTGRTK